MADAGAAPPASAAPGRIRGIQRSVFAHLVAIMVTMAACLLLLVGAFFWFLVGPDLHSSVDRLFESYAHTLAATAPDRATATDLARRLNLQTRYDGPAGNWTTDGTIPGIDGFRSERTGRENSGLLRRTYALVSAPDGGNYLFAWRLGERMAGLHSALILLLLVVMTAVFAVAYLVLKHLLRPLRTLNDGVTRLSAGQLDVALPVETSDEFGRLTTAFNDMVVRVRAMIGARDQLLQDVSHELRSPVTRVRVALELMPPSERRATMTEDLAEMERMIAELLELERLRCGRGLEPVRQDLLPLLHAAAAEFRDRLPEIRIQPPATPAFVRIDAEKIRTVLRNLLENAMKYSSPESGPVEISVGAAGDTIVVRVADDGPGIPASEVDRVFEPFFRVDRSRSKDTGGYGLGLSICKRVMQAHGGDIVLAPPTGAGATFLLTFPLAR